MRYIPIATITKPHGVHGAVKVKSHTDFKTERFKKGQRLFVYFKETYLEVTVEKHQSQKDHEILTFKEFNAPEAVEKYRGCDVFIADEDRAELTDDAFYYDDLEGMQVKEGKQEIGTVIRVVEMPQSAMLRVRKHDGKEVLVPFLKAFIEKVDKTERMIYIHVIEGLL